METINKKRILIISPFASPNTGGVESHLDKLMSYLIKKDYFPILITYQPLSDHKLGEAREITDTYEIYRVKWFGHGIFNKIEHNFPLTFLYLFPGLYLFTFFYYLANYKNIHCVHAHGFIAAAITRLMIATFKKRAVVSTHAIYRLTERKVLAGLIKFLLSGFDQILGVSEVSKQELIAIGLPKEKVSVHKNWIDLDRFVIKERSKARQEMGITFARNFLFIGRFIEKKGIKLFLEAAQRLPEYGFHIVGNGTLEEEVKEAAKSSNIKYYGVLSQGIPEEREKILNLYNLCDFTISPYLYDEGFSAVLIESVGCGTPVIITNRGSPPTFLDKSTAEFLSHDPTTGELVDRLKDDKLFSKFSRPVCRKFAEDHFGYKNVQEIVDTYD